MTRFIRLLVLLAVVFCFQFAQAAPPVASGPPVIPSAPQGGAVASAASAEDWKGGLESAQWSFSAMTGLGVVNATAGWAIIGAAAKKILDRGFIPDINNSVWLEAELGPVIAKGSAGLLFSGHLRWDFVKDSDWTFYALGGLGGATTSEALGDKFEFYPRLGVGALWKLFDEFTLRGEVSHELIVLGAQFEF